MNADGTNFVQLTDNAVFDGTPTFSPDGQKIVFHRTMPPPPMTTERQTQQLPDCQASMVVILDSS